MMRQPRVWCVLRAGEQTSAKDQDLRQVGCGVSPLTFDRGQSKAWNWCLRNFSSRLAPQAETKTKVRDQVGASLGGLGIRQGDQEGAGGPDTKKGGPSGPSSQQFSEQ